MANVFDQFDAPPQAPADGNPFDKFDYPELTERDLAPSGRPGSLVDALQNIPAQMPSQFSSGMGPEVPVADNPDYQFTKATRGGLPGIVADSMGALQQKVVEPAGAAILNSLAQLGEGEAGIAPDKNPDDSFKPGEPIIPNEALPMATEKGIVPALTRALQGFTTPGSLITLPLAPESKLVQTGFMAGAASGIPDSLQKMANAKDPGELRDAATELGMNVGMAALMGKGIAKETPEIPLGEPMTPEAAAANAEAVRTSLPPGFTPKQNMVNVFDQFDPTARNLGVVQKENGGGQATPATEAVGSQTQGSRPATEVQPPRPNDSQGQTTTQPQQHPVIQSLQDIAAQVKELENKLRSSMKPNDLQTVQGNAPEVRTPDGQIDPIQTAIERMRAESQAPNSGQIADRQQTDSGQAEIPQLPTGNRLVTVQRPDGSTYQAAFGDKYYDHPTRGQVPSIAKVVNGGWSHGMLAKGEKILGENASESQQQGIEGNNIQTSQPAVEPATSTPPVASEISRPEGEAQEKAPAAVVSSAAATEQSAPDGTVVKAIGSNAIYTKRNGDWFRRHNMLSSDEKITDPDVIAAAEAKTQTDSRLAELQAKNSASLTSRPESATKAVPAPGTDTGQNGEKAPDAAVATSLATEQMPAESEINPKTSSESVPKYRVGSNPTLHTIVEKLPATDVEIENGEQPVRIRNERTGEESTVLESDLTPVKERTPDQRAAKKLSAKDLNAALQKAGLDPSVFPDAKSKKSALDRLDKKLEDIQTRIRSGKSSFTGVIGLEPLVLDSAISVARLAIKGGKTIGRAIQAAIEWLHQKHPNLKFDEDEFRGAVHDNLSEENPETLNPDLSDQKQQLVELAKAHADIKARLRNLTTEDYNSPQGQQLLEQMRGMRKELDERFKKVNQMMIESGQKKSPVQAIIEKSSGIKETNARKTDTEAALKQSERAGNAGYKRGVAEGRATAMAESRPKIAALKEQLDDSVGKAEALNHYFRGQEKAGKLATEQTRRDLKEADDWMEATARKLRSELTDYLETALPPDERGKFIRRIGEATRRQPLLNGDVAAMFQRAEALTKLIARRADEVHRNGIISDIKDSVKKAVASPTVDVKYKAKIIEAVQHIGLSKLSSEKENFLKGVRDYIARAGDQSTVPDEIVSQIDLLSKTPAKDLPINVLEAVRDKVNLLEQLGRTLTRTREYLYENEKNALIADIASAKSRAIDDLPERRSPGIKLSLTERITQRVGNKIRAAINYSTRTGRTLLVRDVMLDMLDGDANYRGALNRIFGGRIDADYNSEMNLRAELHKPFEALSKKFGHYSDHELERISIFAISKEENGIARLKDSGVSTHTIKQIQDTMTPKEMAYYRAARKLFDESVLPSLTKFMRDNYNVEVKPVQNYWPFQRDNTLIEADKSARPSKVEKGNDVDFDELAAWRQLENDFLPRRTTKAEQGMTIERVPEARGAVRLNAAQVVNRHLNDFAHLISTQRNLRMLGQIARSKNFATKYGALGRDYVLNLLDTVARNSAPVGSTRTAWIDWLQKNTSVGIIGLRLLSQMKHAPNVAFSIKNVRPDFLIKGLVHAFTPQARAFIKNNFAEIAQRYGGEVAIEDLIQGNWVRRFQAGTFFLERGLDSLNARATVLGRYMQEMANRGVDSDDIYNVPVDKEAQRMALVIARQSVTSPLLKDVPQAISRGALTGNNISFARALFQFQTTMLRQAAYVKHDIYDMGIRKMLSTKGTDGKMQFTAATLAFMAMLYAESKIIESNKHLIGSSASQKEEESTEHEMMVEALKRVPFAGNLISGAEYGETGIPLIDTLVKGTHATGELVSGKGEFGKKLSPRESAKTKADVAAFAGEMLGIPGAATAAQIYKNKVLPPPKK